MLGVLYAIVLLLAVHSISSRKQNGVHCRTVYISCETAVSHSRCYYGAVWVQGGIWLRKSSITIDNRDVSETSIERPVLFGQCKKVLAGGSSSGLLKHYTFSLTYRLATFLVFSAVKYHSELTLRRNATIRLMRHSQLQYTLLLYAVSCHEMKQRRLPARHKMEQHRQCVYDIKTRRVRATNVAVEKQWILHSLSVCICSLRYPACNAHAPYCHLWPAPLYNIFFTFSHKRLEFRKKKLLNIKCVFWFALQVFSETFLILRRTERDTIKNVYWSSCKVIVIRVRF